MIGLSDRPSRTVNFFPQPATQLSPAQAAAYEHLYSAANREPLVQLTGGPGAGKTTLLMRLAVERKNAKFIIARDLFRLTVNTAHAGIEDALLQLVEEALLDHDTVIFEDFDAIGHFLADGAAYASRPFLWEAPIKSLLDRARAQGKCIIISGTDFSYRFGDEEDLMPVLAKRAEHVHLSPMSAADYAFHLRRALDANLADQIDPDRLAEIAPSINGHQLEVLCGYIQAHGRADEAFIRQTLEDHVTSSTLDAGEVENLTFADLKGFDHIAEQLTTYVINPLRHDGRFPGLKLRPKRGVLLYGPPGTGKTSVGRALARQMKGKFFLIDGSVGTDPSWLFYMTVEHVFKRAKNAAPSVVFIDDADVLFQTDRGTGLTRYLLTMLDGLESESAGRVAVILTAMDPNHLPPALLRSGRVELWLETKPPGRTARTEMIAAHLRASHDIFEKYDPNHSACLSEGFNAADIRRLVMDAKAFYASDILASRTPRAVEDYFERAAAEVAQNRNLLAQSAVGQLQFSPPAVRTETDKKKSRLRDQSNQCGLE